MGCFFRVLVVGRGDGDGGRKRDLVFNSGYHDLGLLQVDYHWLFMCTCQVDYYSYAKDIINFL